MKIIGKTLLKTAAVWTEATHSSLRQFEQDHYYVRKCVGTEEYKKAQHKSTVHFNTINLGD